MDKTRNFLSSHLNRHRLRAPDGAMLFSVRQSINRYVELARKNPTQMRFEEATFARVRNVNPPYLCEQGEKELERRSSSVYASAPIMDTRDSMPASWVAMIAGGDEKRAKANKVTNAHELGDLTISGFNNALGNKGFKDRRDRTDSEGREVGDKNGLKLNAEIAAAQAWSVTQIDALTTTPVGRVMRLFALTGGKPC